MSMRLACHAFLMIDIDALMKWSFKTENETKNKNKNQNKTENKTENEI